MLRSMEMFRIFRRAISRMSPFESYSDLDALGRCGVAYASVSTDTMPTEKRGSIGEVKPTGWHNKKYDFVDGKICITAAT